MKKSAVGSYWQLIYYTSKFGQISYKLFLVSEFLNCRKKRQMMFKLDCFCSMSRLKITFLHAKNALHRYGRVWAMDIR